MREIGSEFWEIEQNKQINNLETFNLGKDTKYLMSGMTAIKYIIDNLDDETKIVYMPDYCCESMIKPFLDSGYKIKYYHIDLINNIYHIDPNTEFSVFFAMNYFGYSITNMENYIKIIKNKGKIVIEDITHSLLQEKSFSKSSDYLIASLRKWFPIYTGAIAVNLHKNFKIKTDNYIVDHELVNQKKAAMHLKKMYIEKEIDEKEKYLNLFFKSNEKILNYEYKLMDQESQNILKTLDIKAIKDNRRKNVQKIEQILKNNSQIQLIFELKEKDCPLFVPIISKNRDKLKEKLIENKIYCPVHWPNSNQINNEIYNLELSLICDQRYNTKDIEKYIKKLIECQEVINNEI